MNSIQERVNQAEREANEVAQRQANATPAVEVSTVTNEVTDQPQEETPTTVEPTETHT